MLWDYVGVGEVFDSGWEGDGKDRPRRTCCGRSSVSWVLKVGRNEKRAASEERPGRAGCSEYSEGCDTVLKGFRDSVSFFKSVFS